MKSIILFIVLIITNPNSQQLSVREVKIEYSNGMEVFHVYERNPDIDFLEKKEYFWYTEYSGFKSTRGGTGGLLLNGEYKFYDSDGNLILSQSYKNGLKNGKFTEWDENGSIINKEEFIDGNLTYSKFHEKGVDGKYYIQEWIGEMFKVGFKRNAYLEVGGLISEEELIDDSLLLHSIRTYYPFSHKLETKLFATGLGRDKYYGEYLEFYENGNPKIKGEFAKSILGSFRSGKWFWYNENGDIYDTASYKLFEEKYDNGETRIIGSLVYDEDSKEWLRDGKWRTFSEEGYGKVDFIYEWGVLQEN